MSEILSSETAIARSVASPKRRLQGSAAVALVTVISCAPVARAAPPKPKPGAAALQVALRSQQLYDGTIDGIFGPGTRSALIAFQRHKGLTADGVPGPRTRRALGRRGRPSIGKRVIAAPARGWDVAALQFALAWRGFPSGRFDGGFGERSRAALIRYQQWAGLTADGVAGPATWRSVRRSPPRSKLRFRRPSAAAIGDLFGPRGDSFHSGLDFTDGYNASVRAAGRGCVSTATHVPGGYGRLVVITHRAGMTSWYAHLNRILVRPGQCVRAGRRIGLVGSSGRSSGPHLHFELRLRGAVVDPLSGL